MKIIYLEHLDKRKEKLMQLKLPKFSSSILSTPHSSFKLIMHLEHLFFNSLSLRSHSSNQPNSELLPKKNQRAYFHDKLGEIVR